MEVGEVRRSSEGNPGKGSTWQQKVKSSPSEPLLSTHSHSTPRPSSLSSMAPGSSPAPWPPLSHDRTASSGLDSTDDAFEEPEEAAEPTLCDQGPSPLQADSSIPQEGAVGMGAKNSPYPDEQAVKDYLKRLSDYKLSEQAAKSPPLPLRSQVRSVHRHTHTHTHTHTCTCIIPAVHHLFSISVFLSLLLSGLLSCAES